MKLEAKTIQILKNFSSINPSIKFKPGTYLTTCSPRKTVMAKATIKEDIPSKFAIYDISRFLGVLSLFDTPELEIGDRSMEIVSGTQKVNYTFAAENLVVAPEDKAIKMPDTEINFRLTSDDLSKVLKALGVLQLPEIAVTGNGENIFLEALDHKNPSGDSYKVSLGETDLTFKMIFSVENIKIMPGDYDVAISSKGIAHFVGTDVEYWIATEASSTFNG